MSFTFTEINNLLGSDTSINTAINSIVFVLEPLFLSYCSIFLTILYKCQIVLKTIQVSVNLRKNMTEDRQTNSKANSNIVFAYMPQSVEPKKKITKYNLAVNIYGHNLFLLFLKKLATKNFRFKTPNSKSESPLTRLPLSTRVTYSESGSRILIKLHPR